MENKKYFEKLKYTIEDKEWFLDQINPSYIIDFGCADGYLIDRVTRKNNINGVGYDRTDIIEKAGKSAKHNEKVKFTSDFDNLKFLVENNDQKNNLLILSSVLHEIYSQGNEEQVNFWKIIRKLRPKYIAIRDMNIEGKQENLMVSICSLMQQYIREGYWEVGKRIEEKNNGVMDSRFFLDLLLRYPHLDNIDNEINEDYLSVDVEDVKRILGVIGYDLEYRDNYKLNYFENLAKGLDIKLTVNTHCKLLFKRNDDYFPALKARNKFVEQDIVF